MRRESVVSVAGLGAGQVAPCAHVSLDVYTWRVGGSEHQPACIAETHAIASEYSTHDASCLQCTLQPSNSAVPYVVPSACVCVCVLRGDAHRTGRHYHTRIKLRFRSTAV